MRTTLIRIGNSLGIRIASSVLKELGWKKNDPIEFNVEDGKLVLAIHTKLQMGCIGPYV